MAQVTLGFDELERNDLPPVCVVCGARRDVEFVQRRFMWRPLFAPAGLIMLLTTKRVTAEIPLCPEHGGPRLFAHQRFTWWGLKTVAIDSDRLTLGRVAEEFADALDRWRERRRRGEIDEPPPPRQRRVEMGRGPGGGGTVLKVLGILLAVMAGLVVVMVLGMFGLMALGMLFLPKLVPPPPAPPTPVVGPAAVAEPRPEGVVVGLLAAAPPAAGPAVLPWAPLALAGRKDTFHILDDAELDKALADLKARAPFTVEDAAKRLAKATPTEARRKETAQALAAALSNPFPSAKGAAAEALGVWGTGDDVPTLSQLLGDVNPDTRAAAITALAALKDERAAAAVAGRLSDFFDREKARQALEAMGPVAEKAVVPLVNHGDPQTRVEACGVLKAIGTKDSATELELASRDADRNVAGAATAALQAVRGRDEGKRP